MSCGCQNGAGCSDSGGCKPYSVAASDRLMSEAAWTQDVTGQLQAHAVELLFDDANPIPGWPVSKALANWTRHPIQVNRGSGWLELSSPDCMAIWAIETARNGLIRTEYRRTGPASRDGVHLEAGLVSVRYWVVGVAGFHVNPENGLRGGLPLLPLAPMATARFWAGAPAYDFMRPETYTILLDGEERPNSGGFVVGYPVGYTRWAAGTFGRSITWQVSPSDVSPTLPGNAYAYEKSAEYIAVNVSPWHYLQCAVGGGAERSGVVTWSVLSPGLNHG